MPASQRRFCTILTSLSSRGFKPRECRTAWLSVHPTVHPVIPKVHCSREGFCISTLLHFLRGDFVFPQRVVHATIARMLSNARTEAFAELRPHGMFHFYPLDHLFCVVFIEHEKNIPSTIANEKKAIFFFLFSSRFPHTRSTAPHFPQLLHNGKTSCLYLAASPSPWELYERRVC